MSNDSINKNDQNDDTLVTFVEGASTIDMSALRAEMEQDPELQKDVLDGYDAAASDAELEQLSVSMKKTTDKQAKEFAKLAKKVAKDLTSDLEVTNQLMITEDQVLEATHAAERDAEALAAQNASDKDSIETEEMSEQDAELKAALPQLNEAGEYNLDDLQSCIEALLFYSDKPVSLKRLKEMLEMQDSANEPMLQAIELLKANYASTTHGFEVAEIAGGYQLRTKVSKAPLLRKLAKVQVQRLSRGAMEALTIVAYKQPCTKDDIDQVRGVDSSHFIRTLIDRNLIEIKGRDETPGRPMIYSTTDHFLEVFGMMDIAALPALREIEAMVPQLAATEEGAEDPRVIQMRKMVQQMKADSTALDYDAREDEKLLSEIRERVKTIDITTPYLAKQKELAEQGITGADAEALLAKEFGFANATSGGEAIQTDIQTELNLGDNGLDAASITDSLELSAAELEEIASERAKTE